MFESQSTMFDMAEDTGGKAFVNTNGLAQAVESVVDSGANYYTLTYTPSDANAHGEYRSIRVEVNGSGYKLAYRRGYYAETNTTAAVRKADRSTSDETLKSAKAYTAPAATQIPFYARVLPTPAQTEGGDTGRKEVVKAGDVLYSVEYSIDPRGLSIETSADGSRHGHLEFVAVVFDGAGKVVNTDVKSARVTWNAAQFAVAMQQGVRYQQQISVPAKDRSSLRVLVHDLLGDKVGAIDVPVGKDK
jgi:hypothetical protein